MLITININDTPVKDLLARLSAQMNDMTPVMRNIGEIVRTSIERNFAEEGRPVKWQKSKRGGQTLSDTGRLRRSFTVQPSAKSVEVGTNVEYAPFLQEGTKPFLIMPKSKKALFWKGAGHPVKKVNHPGLVARPFVMVQDKDWDSIRNAIEKYLTAGTA